MDIGVTLSPADYGTYAHLNTPPAFARVFSPPGAGLPRLQGHAIAQLPAGTVPWISHKDQVPVADLVTCWAALGEAYPGKVIPWTYHHEAAPLDEAGRLDYLTYWEELLHATLDYPHIEGVQIQTNYAMRWRPDTDWRKWIIAGVSLGFDCYPLQHYRYEPPESMFGVLLEARLEFGVPAWGVPELGADAREGQDRGAWLKECVTYLDTVDCHYVGLWGAGTTYAPHDQDLLDAFNTMVGP